MSQYRRWRLAGGTYFFTLVTYQRRPFLTSDAARRSLREAFREVRVRRPFRLVAIVLLPDHLHAVWELPTGDANYSVRWRQIKSIFTRRYAQCAESPALTASRQARNEHGVWQRRFYEHTCRDEADVKRCVDYMHYNPVKHGHVQRVQDWPWSSFHRFVRQGEYELNWGERVHFPDREFRWAE